MLLRSLRRALLLAALAAVGVLTSPAVRGQETERGTSTSSDNTAYIDGATPVNMFRLRFDAAYDANRPDRAEFIYSQYQQQRIVAGGLIYVNTPIAGRVTTGGGGGGGGGGPGPNPNRGRDIVTVTAPGDLVGNPNARGLPRPETKIDYQDISSYLELKANDRLSGFLEVPVRFLNPEINTNTAGLADMNAGFKWAFLFDPCRVASFQLRTYIPTGASTHGLGTNHVSLEPGLLYHQQIGDRLMLDFELKDWIPVGGTDFEGNVVRYGAGISYTAYQNCRFRVVPVAEFVGWTVLNGKETAALSPTVFEIRDAGGDTIINAKAGVRCWFGKSSDFYAGFGRALTGQVWYKDMFRVEYRLNF